MITANELRIGNWVLGNGLWCCVTAHDIYMMDSDKLVSDPIPLTPEILEKAGFVAEGSYGIYKCKDGRYWELYADEFYLIHRGTKISLPVKSLHQLQNLYFALTGTELTVNL